MQSTHAAEAKYGACEQTLEVAIVGAGVSGAYAAYKLREKGLKIGVFEHSARVGGRVFTTRLAENPDQIIELGGMRFIKDAQKLISGWIDELQLPTKEFTRGEHPTLGPRVFCKRDLLSLTPEEFLNGEIPYDLTEEEKEHQADLFMYYLRKLTNDPIEDLSDEHLYNLEVPDGRKLYMLTPPEAIGLVASEEGASYVMDGNYYNSECMSAIDSIDWFKGEQGDAAMGEKIILTVEDGMSSVPIKALEQFLKASPSHHSLHMNRRLLSIEPEKGSELYKLVFQHTQTVDGETTDIPETSAQEIVYADKIILAVPKFALSYIQWSHLRCQRYQELLHSTRYEPASKVFMTFPRAWWLHADEVKVPSPHVDATSLGLGELYHWEICALTGHATLLVSYNSGDGTLHQHALNGGRRDAKLNSHSSANNNNNYNKNNSYNQHSHGYSKNDDKGHHNAKNGYGNGNSNGFQKVECSVEEQHIHNGSLLDGSSVDQYPRENGSNSKKRSPDPTVPIEGSPVGAQKVTEPLKELLLEKLSKVFGIRRCDIPEPVSAISSFWVDYPYGGGWLDTRPGYTSDNGRVAGFTRPSETDNVFVVGSDFSSKGERSWIEGGLVTVEAVLEKFF